MKPNLYLSALLLAVAFLIPKAHAQFVDPVEIHISPTSVDPIIIDGNDTEVSWSDAQNLPDPFSQIDWTGNDDMSGYFKTSWDIQNFYFFARVTDEFSRPWMVEYGNWWEFDYVWLFFNMDTSQAEGPLYNEDATNIAFMRELNDTIGGELSWNEERSALADIDFVISEYGSYYTVEAAIPWVLFLPGPVEAVMPEDIHEWLDKSMGFDVHFIDSDSDDPDVGGRSAHSAWDLDGNDGTEDNAWNNTTVFGIVELSGVPGEVPVANAGEDQEVDELSLVTLDGKDSFDPEDDPLTYTWTAPPGIVLSDITSITPTFTAPEVSAATDFNFSLRVSDGIYVSSADYVTVTVNQVNVAPIAHAGSDQVVNERQLVMLDGSLSSDFDGDPITYQWTPPLNISLINSTGANPLLVAPDVLADSSFSFILHVSDGSASSDPDTMLLHVKSLGDEYDTLVVYDTVYVVSTENHFNTIMITVVDIDDGLIAREIEGQLVVELFPNPAEQFINIRSEENILQVTIVDMQGNILTIEEPNDLAASLNLGGLTAGNYVIVIETDSGQVEKVLILE